MKQAGRGITVGMLIAVLGSALVAPAARAHEKWFYAGEQPHPRLHDVTSRPVLVAVGIVVGMTGLLYLCWRLRGRRDVIPGPNEFGATAERCTDFYAIVPAILAVHLAVPLLVCGVQGNLFSPNLSPPGAWRYLLGVSQTGIALALFYGGLTRLASIVLILVWLVGIGVSGIETMLENIHYVGFAAFFFLAGRGPLSIDRVLFPKLEPATRLEDFAMPALRTGIGLSLVILAFTEKLANLDLARDFLRQHPLNFTPALGIGMSDTTFAVCAGGVELFIGLMILFGLFPRPIILLAWLPFNLTLTVFGWVEFVGHLPFYGAMAALLVWTPLPTDRKLWREGVLRKFLSAEPGEKT